MVAILVGDIEHAQEHYAFRQAVSYYEYLDFKASEYALRTFQEAMDFEPKFPDRIAFQVFCPTIVFTDDSTMKYYLAGILYRRFPSKNEVIKFVKRRKDWRAYSREDLDDQLERVRENLQLKPDRGKFLRFVRMPIKPPYEPKSVRDIRNPPDHMFVPLTPINRQQLEERFGHEAKAFQRMPEIRMPKTHSKRRSRT